MITLSQSSAPIQSVIKELLINTRCLLPQQQTWVGELWDNQGYGACSWIFPKISSGCINSINTTPVLTKNMVHTRHLEVFTALNVFSGPSWRKFRYSYKTQITPKDQIKGNKTIKVKRQNEIWCRGINKCKLTWRDEKWAGHWIRAMDLRKSTD